MRDLFIGGWRKAMFGLFFIMSLILAMSVVVGAADTDTYEVKSGDSLWKIAVKYQVGLSEIIASNPRIENPALIFPGDKVVVPLMTDVKSIENRVVQLVNVQRAKYNVPPLVADWELARVARLKSADMRDRNYFAHESPTYGSPFAMMKSFGIRYTAAAENVASGQTTAEQVVESWMNSAGHRQNILNREFTHIGVGFAAGGKYRYYWTQMFIRK